jgi:hypothetical protein
VDEAAAANRARGYQADYVQAHEHPQRRKERGLFG